MTTLSPPDDHPATGALAPFAYSVFRAIWTANMLSSIGSVMQAVAAAWLMTELTRLHLLVALVQASSTIPILLLGVFAGAIADNHDRRVVMLIAQTFMLVVSTVLSIMGYLGALTPVSLLLLTLLVGLGTALNGPAWQASVRLQVGHKTLPQAVALNAIAMNLARSLGPALGGVVISIWSVNLAFALNAISYLAMIVVLLRWRPEVTPPTRVPMGEAILTGLRFCASSRPVSRVLLRGLVFGFGAAGFQALNPVVVRTLLHGNQIDYGLVVGCFGTGSIVSALMVSAIRRRFGSETVVGGGTLIMASALFALSWAQTIPQALLAAFVIGTGWVAAFTSLNVAMQLRSPEAILARCLSIYQATTFGGMALGAWAWGWLADRIGIAPALHVSVGWLVLTVILRFVAPMPGRDEGRIALGENPA